MFLTNGDRIWWERVGRITRPTCKKGTFPSRLRTEESGAFTSTFSTGRESRSATAQVFTTTGNSGEESARFSAFLTPHRPWTKADSRWQLTTTLIHDARNSFSRNTLNFFWRPNFLFYSHRDRKEPGVFGTPSISAQLVLNPFNTSVLPKVSVTWTKIVSTSTFSRRQYKTINSSIKSSLILDCHLKNSKLDWSRAREIPGHLLHSRWWLWTRSFQHFPGPHVGSRRWRRCCHGQLSPGSFGYDYISYTIVIKYCGPTYRSIANVQDFSAQPTNIRLGTTECWTWPWPCSGSTIISTRLTATRIWSPFTDQVFNSHCSSHFTFHLFLSSNFYRRWCCCCWPTCHNTR